MNMSNITAKRRKPAGYRSILQFDNAKTSKGESLGYRTGILYLAPADESGRVNLCTFSTVGCRKDCLYTSGLASVHASINRARVSKTYFMLDHPQEFIASLRYDIESLVIYCEKHNLIPCVRINGTSDQPKLAMEFARLYPQVQFYDYTKLPKPHLRTLPNYHLTFSRSESNEADCIEALNHGINVAVVFDTKKGHALPAEFMGRKVIDGDVHDLRFLDPKGLDTKHDYPAARGVIVGLRAKGEARKDTASGFVQITLKAA